MKNSVIITFSILAAISSVSSQPRREVFALSHGDTVALYMMTPPSSLQGFLVYRQGPLPTREGYTLLTKESPIRPVVDPENMMAMLGPDWDLVARATETDDPFIALRRIRGNEMLGRSLSLLSPRVAQITGRWFCDTAARRGKDYSYKIVVVDDTGNRLDSTTVRMTLTDYAPAPPTNVRASLGDGGVKLTWEYPKWKGLPNDAAVRFDVYRRAGKEKMERVNLMPILRSDASLKQYVDLLFSYGTEYTYSVTATDPLGWQSKPSVPITFTPQDKTPPAVPAGLQTQSGESSVLLTWNMSLDLDAAGYNVYRATGLKEEPVRLTKAVIKLDKPFYVDSTVQSYRQYFYSVTALDNANNESAHSNAIMAMTKDLTPPGPPSDMTFKLERRVLKLSWKPSPSMDAVGYNVYRGETLERQPLVNRDAIRATVYADSGYQGKGLIPGRRFLISLTAVDSARNESKRVTAIVDVPDDEPPTPPQSFHAENVEGRYVEVSCGPSQSFDVAAYELYRSDEKKSDTRLTQFHLAPFRYRDTTVTKGTRYRYYAIAVDSAGNRSEKSRIDTILVRDFTPPPSPRNLAARVTQQGVEVKWERVVDFDLDGYVVFRSDIPGGSGIRVSKSPVKSLSFIDPEGKRNNYYTVRAIDTSTNESVASSWVQAH